MMIVPSGLPQGLNPRALGERMSIFGPVTDVKAAADSNPERMASVETARGAVMQHG